VNLLGSVEGRYAVSAHASGEDVAKVHCVAAEVSTPTPSLNTKVVEFLMALQIGFHYLIAIGPGPVSATNESASLTFSGLFNPEEPDWLLQAIASAATIIAPTTKTFLVICSST